MTSKVETYILGLLNLCLKPTVHRAHDYYMQYFSGSRKKGFISFKVGDTIIDKWAGSRRSSETDKFFKVGWWSLKSRNMDEGLPDNYIYVQIEHPEFLAEVQLFIIGSGKERLYLSEIRPPIPLLSLEIFSIDFVGSEEALENEVLIANLSHDFG